MMGMSPKMCPFATEAYSIVEEVGKYTTLPNTHEYP
jgi:hypothetical protein